MVLEVQECAQGLYHHAKFGGPRISPTVMATKNIEFFCLSVCPSRFCRSEFFNDFAMKSLDYNNSFDTVA